MSSEFERIQTVQDEGFQHFNQFVGAGHYRGKSFCQKCLELEEQFQIHQDDNTYDWRLYSSDLSYVYEDILGYFFTRLTGKKPKKLTKNEKEIDLAINAMVNDPDFLHNLKQKGSRYFKDYGRWANNIREIRNPSDHPNDKIFNADTAEELLQNLRRLISAMCDIIETLDPVLTLGEIISVDLKENIVPNGNTGVSRYLETNIKGKKNQAVPKDLEFCWQSSAQSQDFPQKRRIPLPDDGKGDVYRCIVTSELIPGQIECIYEDEKAELKGSVSIKMNLERDLVRTLTADVKASVNGRTIPRSELTFQWFNEANEKLPTETETIKLLEPPEDKKYHCIITYKSVSGPIEGTFLDERPTLTGEVTLERLETETKNGIRMLKATVKGCKLPDSNKGREMPDSKLLYEWRDAKTGKILNPASNNRVFLLPNSLFSLLWPIVPRKYQCVVTSEWAKGELSNTFPNALKRATKPETRGKKSKEEKKPDPVPVGPIILASISSFAGLLVLLFVALFLMMNWTFLTKDADTLFDLGMECIEKDDMDHCTEYFKMAQSKGSEDAHMFFANGATMLFDLGIEWIEKEDDVDHGIKYFKMAACKGSEEAYIELGDFYSNHWYVTDGPHGFWPSTGTHIIGDWGDTSYDTYSSQQKNEEEALKWYQRAADKLDSAQGMFRMVEMMLSEGKSYDDTLVWDYLVRAGDQWHSGALVMMAEHYMSIEDYANAYDCSVKATGHDPENPGTTFINGRFYDDPECFYHAATAYYYLGWFYETGIGNVVEQDLEQAIEYYETSQERSSAVSSALKQRIGELREQLDQQVQQGGEE